VEQARKLVETDEVLLISNSLGTPGNTAIQKYMNTKKVPQIFVSSGAAKWNDPKNFPWTIGWQPNYCAMHIGESRDSGFDAEPLIGPASGRTRWHRPEGRRLALNYFAPSLAGVALSLADGVSAFF
jgi:hypothetical protein